MFGLKLAIVRQNIYITVHILTDCTCILLSCSLCACSDNAQSLSVAYLYTVLYLCMAYLSWSKIVKMPLQWYELYAVMFFLLGFTKPCTVAHTHWEHQALMVIPCFCALDSLPPTNSLRQHFFSLDTSCVKLELADPHLSSVLSKACVPRCGD